MTAVAFIVVVSVPLAVYGSIQQPSTDSTNLLLVFWEIVVALVAGAAIGIASGGLAVLLLLPVAATAAEKPARVAAVFVGAFLGAGAAAFLLIPLFVPWNATAVGVATGAFAAVALSLVALLHLRNRARTV